MALVKLLAATNAVSLLDRAEDEWRIQIGRPAPKDGGPRALLVYAHRRSPTSPTPAAGRPSSTATSGRCAASGSPATSG
jgi:hypothetical protein